MNDRDLLLKAVCDNPDDDTPRLVFADWFQEHGEEERAELIRVQIEYSRHPETAPEREPLWDRAKEILDVHERRWRAEMPVEPGWVWCDFFRGFIDELTVNSYAVPNSDPARAFAAAPLTAIAFSGQPIARWVPFFRHIRQLTLISSPVTDADAAALCAPELGLKFDELLVVDRDDFGPSVWDTLVARFGAAVRFSN
jgi:uncharacterized protein (TIGR02996 family)